METKIELNKMEAFELMMLLFDKLRQLDVKKENMNELASQIGHYEIPSNSKKDIKDERTKTNKLIDKIKVVFFED